MATDAQSVFPCRQMALEYSPEIQRPQFSWDTIGLISEAVAHKRRPEDVLAQINVPRSSYKRIKNQDPIGTECHRNQQQSAYSWLMMSRRGGLMFVRYWLHGQNGRSFVKWQMEEKQLRRQQS